MFKKFAATLLALFALSAFAAVDVNKASQAELDGIKGIGPGIAGKILDERKKGAFKNWDDLVERVKGVGEGNAAKFSAEGLTVNGATYKGAAAKPATAKADAAKADAKPAAMAKTDTKTDAKSEAKAAKADAKSADAKAKPAEKLEKVTTATKDAANDAKAKTLEAVKK